MVKIHAMSLAVLVFLLGGGLSLPANAQQTSGAPMADEAGWLPPGGSIQVRTQQGIRFASGGIGLSGRDELRTLSPQFNLRLMFAMQGSGNYLAGALRNPSAADSQFGRLVFGFAVTEALGIFSLLIALLLLFAV